MVEAATNIEPGLSAAGSSSRFDEKQLPLSEGLNSDPDAGMVRGTQ